MCEYFILIRKLIVYVTSNNKVLAWKMNQVIQLIEQKWLDS